MKKRHNQLEIIVRIKDDDGWVRSDWVFRGDRVELITYWASGAIERQHETDMETFYREFQKHQGEAVPA